MDLPDKTLTQTRTFTAVAGSLTEIAGDYSAVEPFKPGQLIDGKYKIERLMGKGGMGAVYAATHLLLNKSVALKSLLTHVIDSDHFNRFHREALSLSKFRHINVVEIFDFGIADDRPYFTMELLKGVSLADRIAEEGALSQSAVIAIFTKVADALAYAHRLEIIHRDIKPGNILLGSSGATEDIKIVDFGLAKFISEQHTTAEQFATREGAIIGSPLYMSPEQSNGRELDGRSDIYSFGCTFYEALTGLPPFKEASAIETIMAHQLKQTPSLKQAAPSAIFSSRLEMIVGRCLKKDVEDRFQSFDEILAELALLDLSGQPASTAVKNSPTLPVVPSEAPSQKSTKSSSLLVLSISLLFCAGMLTIYFIYHSRPGQKAISKSFEQSLPSISDSKASATAMPPDQVKSENPAITKITIGNQAVYTFSRHSGSASLGLYKRSFSIRDIATTVCDGEVRVDARRKIYLHCLDGITPAFLKAFPPDSIDTIWFDGDNWSPAHLEALTNQNSLTNLSFSSADVTPELMAAARKIKHLKILDVSNSNVDGAMLTPLADWPNLAILYAEGVVNAATALDGKVSESIKEVHFDRDGLTDTDMVKLQKLPNISFLSMNANPKLTVVGLEKLINLPIEDLRLENIVIKPNCTSALIRMKSLKSLNMAATNWTSEEISDLNEKLKPRCQWFITTKKIGGDGT